MADSVKWRPETPSMRRAGAEHARQFKAREERAQRLFHTLHPVESWPALSEAEKDVWREAADS